MEKQIKMTMSEGARWVGAALVVVSAFVVNQVDIQNLKKENAERIEENIRLTADVKKYGETVANLNGKLDEIKETVDAIKDAIFRNQFDTHSK